MTVSECTCVFLAGPRDGEFLGDVVRHLLRMCSFPFREILVVVDDLPRKRSLDSEKEQENFVDSLTRLMRDHTISRCISLCKSASENLGQKYFGFPLQKMRDHRGVPLLGWIAGMEAAQTDFVVHFDSDILLYQSRGYSWIDTGMALIKEDPLAMFVAPFPGPPSGDRTLRAQVVPPEIDERGNLRFKTFSSRRFLVSKQRLEKLIPTPMQYISTKRHLLMQFGFGNSLCPWEHCVSCALEKSNYYRVHLNSPNAWALHCPDHGRAWRNSLSAIIKDVEDGTYPAEQGGYYDLILSAWIESCAARKKGYQTDPNKPGLCT